LASLSYFSVNKNLKIKLFFHLGRGISNGIENYLSRKMRPQNLYWDKFAAFAFGVEIFAPLKPLQYLLCDVCLYTKKR